LKVSRPIDVVAVELLGHLASDETTDLVEKVRVTPANVNDGKAGCHVVPDTPGQVYADSAYCGLGFRKAMEDRGGVARVVQLSVWANDGAVAQQKLRQINQPIHRVGAASKRFSAPGSAATACAAWFIRVSPRPSFRFNSVPSSAISSEVSICWGQARH